MSILLHKKLLRNVKEAMGKDMPAGEHVFDKEVDGKTVMIHKLEKTGKFCAYVDGKKVGDYDDLKSAKKALLGESVELDEKKSNLGRTLKLVNKIKNSGVVKKGSMKKEDDNLDERTQRQSMFNRMFAGKKDTSWMDKSNKKYATKKDEPNVKMKTHTHKKSEKGKGPTGVSHTHTTDHNHKTVR